MISESAMAEMKAMKPQEFPISEKQKEIMAGAQVDAKEYPTEEDIDVSSFGEHSSKKSKGGAKKKSQHGGMFSVIRAYLIHFLRFYNQWRIVIFSENLNVRICFMFMCIYVLFYCNDIHV